jgi:predicted porin
MKKTLIAAGIAAVVAAPAAFADVSISGQVKYTMTDNDTKEWDPSFDNALTFKASEDLGNGLTAFATMAIEMDGSSKNADGDLSNKDAIVGIKGSFGTVMAGRMETLTEGKIMSKMDDGSGGNVEVSSNASSSTRYQAVAYVSPTINGFHAAVAGVQGVDGNGDSTFNDGMFQHMDYALFYDNGPLSVFASKEDIDGGSASDSTTFGASYSMGDLKGTFLTIDNDTNDRDNMYRLDYKMGNNSILIAHLDDDTANSDITSIKLTHSFSKRTAVWVGIRDKGSAVSGGDDTHLGMIHKF